MVVHTFEMLPDLAPGPDLAVALSTVERATTSGHDLVLVLRARARQIAHDQAQLLSDLLAVARCTDADTPPQLTDVAAEFAAIEIAAALHWTRRAAEGWLELAEALVERLPAVHATLLAGDIDLPRARVIVEELAALPDEAARAIAEQALPQAVGLTTGQLRVRLRRLVAAEDPAAAQRRYEKGVKERRLLCGTEPDGTAVLAGHCLPVDRAAAAVERVNALAKAAKGAGDPRTMDQLRADTFLDLLTGERDAVDAPDDRIGSPDGGADPARGRRSRRATIELSVPLTTLMRLSESPGELAGWGPVVADLARQVAAQQREGTWRFAVTDQTGRLLHTGVTRRRPTGTEAADVRTRDRHCLAPGCRMPARDCEVDHRRRHTDGGPTAPENLETLCRHHHRAKDRGRWRLRKADDDLHIWTSPLGHTYFVRPEPRFVWPESGEPP